MSVPQEDTNQDQPEMPIVTETSMSAKDRIMFTLFVGGPTGIVAWVCPGSVLLAEGNTSSAAALFALSEVICMGVARLAIAIRLPESSNSSDYPSE